MSRWRRCTICKEEQATVDPETGKCQNGCAEKTPPQSVEQRIIPATNEIKLWFHCSNCLPDKPARRSPAEWVRLEAGWTKLGVQIRCQRCDLNIIHIDFEGRKHPANLAGQQTDTFESACHPCGKVYKMKPGNPCQQCGQPTRSLEVTQDELQRAMKGGAR